MQRFKKILFVAEPDLDNATALKRAITLAINNQASLTVVGVVTALPRDMRMAIVAVTPTEMLDSVVDDERDRLSDMVKVANSDDELAISIEVLVGKAFLEIIREVLRNDHDLVIKSAESEPEVVRIFGSTDMHLMRKCPCPVWVIKPTDHVHYRRILAAVDQDSEDAVKDVLNRQILEMSTSLAIAESSELHIVHAWKLAPESYLRSLRLNYAGLDVDANVREEEDSRQRWLEKLVSTFSGPKGSHAVDYLEPHLHLVKGDPQHEVPRIARELDVELVVMGTVARTGTAGLFMGNTAESILNQLDCSVLTMKPTGFVSPIGTG
jgi:nucleotide-binding universal stress UspA family protein